MFEFANNKVLLFDVWDGKHDQVLVPEKTPLRPDAFQRSAGADGRITPFEFIIAANDVFHVAGTYHDGALGHQEFEALARTDFDSGAVTRRVRRP